MPFAYHSGAVALGFEQISDRFLSSIQQSGCIAREDFGTWIPPGILPGQEGVAARRTGSRSGISIGEAQATLRQFIDIRRSQLAFSVGTDVTNAQIIGVNDKDVGLVLGE